MNIKTKNTFLKLNIEGLWVTASTSPFFKCFWYDLNSGVVIMFCMIQVQYVGAFPMQPQKIKNIMSISCKVNSNFYL